MSFLYTRVALGPPLTLQPFLSSPCTPGVAADPVSSFAVLSALGPVCFYFRHRHHLGRRRPAVELSPEPSSTSPCLLAFGPLDSRLHPSPGVLVLTARRTRRNPGLAEIGLDVLDRRMGRPLRLKVPAIGTARAVRRC